MDLYRKNLSKKIGNEKVKSVRVLFSLFAFTLSLCPNVLFGFVEAGVETYLLLSAGLPGRVQLDRARHSRAEMLRVRDPRPYTLATVFISETRTYYPGVQGREPDRRATFHTEGFSLE